MLPASKKKTLRETAINWFIRLQKMDADHPDRSRFEAWLMADSSHQRMYAEVEGMWHQLDSTPQLERLTAALQKKQNLKRSDKLKAAFTAFSITVLAACSFYGFQSWQAQPLMHMVATAEVGQIKTQALEDGSKVIINAQSDVEITYYRNKRLVKLNRGEAIFEVTKDADRPFVVDSGSALVTVLGTRFAVNRLHDLVRISVDHGKVEVKSRNTDGSVVGKAVYLVNGQVAEIEPGKLPKRISRPASDAFSFEQGIIIFNEATLGEISNTLSRYRMPLVDIQPGTLPHTRITAVVKTRNVERFLATLPDLAPVRLDYQRERTIIANSARIKN